MPGKRYARKEVIEVQYTEVIRRITLPPMLVEWATAALAESHRDAKQLQIEAAKRLKSEHSRLQKRLDAMYLDKLDGRITECDRQEDIDNQALENALIDDLHVLMVKCVQITYRRIIGKPAVLRSNSMV